MTTTHSGPSYVELVHTMGTVVSLDVRSPRRPDCLDQAFADATEQLYKADALFSTWQDDSWGSRLLRGEVAVEDCPSRLQHVVRLAQELTFLTGGYFSPYWRHGSGPAGPDPTGLVKGWAAQRASDVLLEHGLSDHVVNAAGDVVVSGSSTPGSTAPWRIGISHPLRPGTLAGYVELAPGRRWAVATSGPAERGLHVVDPHTGAAPVSIASATAVVRETAAQAEPGAWADAAATALVAAGGRAADELARLATHQVRGFLLRADGALTDPDGLLQQL